MNPDIKMIQDALMREGHIEGDYVIVPEDFFFRLNRALNPPRESILDQLIEKETQ